MAVTTFKYATQSDLKNYFNRIGDYDQKVQIFPRTYSSNKVLLYDTGPVDVLFYNGADLGGPEGSISVSNNGEWHYDASEDYVILHQSGIDATTMHEQIYEAGVDFTTYIDQQLVNASLELHNLLDARFPSPLLRVPQIDIQFADGVADTEARDMSFEYDPIVKKAVCYICASNLIRSKEPMSEEADYYYNLVTNAEGTGIIDRLNDGKMKLSFETDLTDSKGSVRRIVAADAGGFSNMEIVEVAGTYVGEDYDLLTIECTSSGVYGTAVCKVQYFGDEKLKGTSSENNIVTGGMDYWSGLSGLGVRFQGNTMQDGDIWEIEVKSATRALTNTVTKNITTVRGGFTKSSKLGSIKRSFPSGGQAYTGGGSD